MFFSLNNKYNQKNGWNQGGEPAVQHETLFDNFLRRGHSAIPFKNT